MVLNNNTFDIYNHCKSEDIVVRNTFLHMAHTIHADMLSNDKITSVCDFL